MTAAVTEIRDVLAGRPGGVNRLIRRYGKSVADYCTALIPDRKPPFDRMVEDVLVDILAQSRAAARYKSDDEVFEFAIEAALRTIRARYRDVLDAGPQPQRATQSYTVEEVLQRTGMTREDLSAGISEGRIRAIRANDSMKVVGENVPGLGPRPHYYAFNISAAERELLCLHFRLGFSAAVIARWAGESQAHIESLIHAAAGTLATTVKAKTAGSAPQDAEMRRYIDGELDHDETAKFERRIVKDKIAQQRLDELRGQSQSIKEMFDSPDYDFSAVSVNVRARNPHHALSLPPSAALWIQIVGIAAMMLMFHRVGAYMAPPAVYASTLAGDVQLPPEGRVRVGDRLKTEPGAQALLVIDGSNRLVMAGGSELELKRPRESARQVFSLHEGEVWGRFTAAGHAFVLELQSGHEVGSATGAEFDVAVNDRVDLLWPENVESERARLLASRFTKRDAGLECAEATRLWAGYRFGGEDEGGLRAGDLVTSFDGHTAADPEALAQAAGALREGASMKLAVRRGNDRPEIPITRLPLKPSCVLRVFQGSVVVAAPEGRFAVNRGQWALIDASGPPLIGRRGMEDFRALRISAGERFKDALHWLNTESFPLRAENSVLAVDRGLRELAHGLEQLRRQEVRRNAQFEIREFERKLDETFEAAQRRIDSGEGKPAGGQAWELSDAQLLAARAEIAGAVEHWRRQSGTGIYTTLGDAAKTIHPAITRGQAELKTRDEEIGRATALRKRLEDLVSAIERQDAELATLKASEFHDADGGKRAAFDSQIAELDGKVRAGAQASGRLDFVKIKLNELDAKIDEQRRKLPELTRNVQDAESALAEIERRLAANIYTPAALKAAQERRGAASDALADEEKRLAKTRADDQTKSAALTEANAKRASALGEITPLQSARDAASDNLAEAVTQRAQAQSEVDERQDDVDALQEELDALPENDAGRAEVQRKLKAAQDELKKANELLQDAQAAADTAKKAKDKADRELADGETKLAQATKARDEAQKAADAAGQANKKQDALAAKRRDELANAEATLSAQEHAKVERALLDTRKAETEGTLGAARDSLKQVQDRIAALDKDAEPRREEFRKELEVVKAGEEARAQLDVVRRERDRYQAVSDEIERRGKDRAALAEEREVLHGSNLVKNFETLQVEYNRLWDQVRALEYLKERAFKEDEIFKHKQQLAVDRFNEAGAQTHDAAVTLLDKFCPAYDARAYAAISGSADPLKLRNAVLGALWTLYYDSSINRDGPGNECYYVLVQSGAAPEAFARLDANWRKYLAEALGKEAYEAISELTADELEPQKG